MDEQAKARWSDVQNRYQRRADLIPNLVATVQGYAKQEKDVLTAVVEARAKATQVKLDVSQLTDPEKVKQFQDAQNQLTGALGRLLAVAENYPDLKSNANFLALQSQLEGTENRISASRRDYIEAVRAYNTEIRPSQHHLGEDGVRSKRWQNLPRTRAHRRLPRSNLRQRRVVASTPPSVPHRSLVSDGTRRFWPRLVWRVRCWFSVSWLAYAFDFLR